MSRRFWETPFPKTEYTKLSELIQGGIIDKGDVDKSRYPV